VGGEAFSCSDIMHTISTEV